MSSQGQKVYVRLREDGGRVWVTVEPQSRPQNWLLHFDTLARAEEYIRKEGLIFNPNTDFYDTRSAHSR